MTIQDIVDTLEEFAPLSLQTDWDNSGRQVGDFSAEATGAVLTFDVTLSALRKAKAIGSNLIISHHPLIFSGLKSVTGDTVVEQIVIEAIKNDIAIYSCHTNIDSARGGVSWAMASRLGLRNTEPLSESGLGCIGELSEELTLDGFIEFIKNSYRLPSVKVNTEAPKRVKSVAVMGGSGASEIGDAIERGADAMVTGDMKYHDFQRAAGRMALIDIGHFESEIDVLGIFLDIIQKKYPTFALHTEKVSFTEIK